MRLSLGEILYWICFAVVAGIAGWLGYRALIGQRGDGRPRCRKCWYDMTGAPSLVCPECGHDAKTADRLHRGRRRHPRAAMLFCLVVLIVTLMWYASVIRWRVRTLGEPLRLAMTPTTALLLQAGYGGPDAFTPELYGRLFDRTTDQPINSRLEQWLAAQLLFRRSMKYGSIAFAPNKSKATAEIEYLQTLALYNRSAASLWLRMALEHPDRATRGLAIRYAINRLNAATFGPDARRQVVAAWRANRVSGWDIGEFLYSIPQSDRERMTDADAVEDASIAFAEPLDINHQERFLAEVVRRKLPAADAIIAAAEKENTYSFEQRILLSMARARLHDQPAPCSIELRQPRDPQADYDLIFTMSDDLREAIRSLRKVRGIAPASPQYAMPVKFRTSDGPTPKQTVADFVTVPVPPPTTTVQISCAITPGPAGPTRIRAVLSTWTGDTIEEIAVGRLMPVSNELVVARSTAPPPPPPPPPMPLRTGSRRTEIITPGDPRH